jgi:2-polyprenyl-3-methyl-5-hydroxy-6-metoxy-1,4-benzoquinol methylase
MGGNIKDDFIARVCGGKTFADIGGLWGTVNEKISIAHYNNASELTMIDIQTEGHKLWQDFHQRMKELGIKNYSAVSGDIQNLTIEPFDVIHSSGILYHLPNPLIYLSKLHSLTRQYMILGSTITHEKIENKYGIYIVPSSGAIFVPALGKQEKAILNEHWQKNNVGTFEKYQLSDYKLNSFGPWWWLPTVNTLKCMCSICGFEVINEGYTWNKYAYALLLKK